MIQQLTGLIGLSIGPVYVRPVRCLIGLSIGPVYVRPVRCYLVGQNGSDCPQAIHYVFDSSVNTTSVT